MEVQGAGDEQDDRVKNESLETGLSYRVCFFTNEETAGCEHSTVLELRTCATEWWRLALEKNQ